jgi:hypothetical protein
MKHKNKAIVRRFILGQGELDTVRGVFVMGSHEKLWDLRIT